MPMTPFQTRLHQVQCVDDAIRLLMDALKQDCRDDLVGGDYPYDVDLGGMLFPVQNRGMKPDEEELDEPLIEKLGPIFADAAWELCREGILRPGPRSPLDRTSNKSTGFTVTERGRQAILNHEIK